MKIGIFGGSFDPIHTGHAMLANFIAQCNVVDEVWLMVSRRNPHKNYPTVASDFHRLTMARIVASKASHVKVTDVEMFLPEPSYTIDSLYQLKKTHPEHDFCIIIGSDSLKNFNGWKDSEKLLKDFGVIVYPRPGYPLPEKEPDGMTFLSGAPEFSISSTLIREYILSGWDINYFVPCEVADYINLNNLYR